MRVYILLLHFLSEVFIHFHRIKTRALIAFTWGVATYKRNGLLLNEDPIKHVSPLHSALVFIEHLVESYKNTTGAPGVSVCVSVGGATVYSKGFGLADVEQGVKVTPDTKFRIASISKVFTSLLVGRMIDQKRIDLDRDVKTYLRGFEPRTEDGESASVTLRQLLSHTSGVRHYSKTKDIAENSNSDDYPSEVVLTKAYKSAIDALDIFKNDSLMHAPGEDYLYSTYGFTVISAVLEAIVAKELPVEPLFERPERLKAPTKVDNQKVPDEATSATLFRQLFTFMNLQNTCLDEPFKIIPFRARPYRREKATYGRLANTPWVDNSSKWAGGGLLSTGPDLIKMANHLVDIYLGRLQPPFAVVSRDTLVNYLWRPNRGTLQGPWLPGGLYGFGWFVGRRSMIPADKAVNFQEPDRLYVGHTGAAVGFTSVLFISLPVPTSVEAEAPISQVPPICVAVLVNLESAAGVGTLGMQIAETLTDVILSSAMTPNYQQFAIAA